MNNIMNETTVELKGEETSLIAVQKLTEEEKRAMTALARAEKNEAPAVYFLSNLLQHGHYGHGTAGAHGDMGVRL